MITDRILRGARIYLRQIALSDCTNKYVEWLNDLEVNQYLETRWHIQDLQSIKDFVTFQRENDNSILFAIIFNNNSGSTHDTSGSFHVKADGISVEYHIGNIKIGPINKHHNRAEISYFIGEKNMWHQGIATEAIRLICDFGFNELNLHKIDAGVYIDAIGSWKALSKRMALLENPFFENIMFLEIDT